MFNLVSRRVVLYGSLLTLVAFWLLWTGRKKFLNSREKSSPFECGFDPKDKSRVPFSIRFFLIIIIFLIFDVEISILLKIPFQLDYEKYKGRLGIYFIIWVLLLGTLEEWRRGALTWKSWVVLTKITRVANPFESV